MSLSAAQIRPPSHGSFTALAWKQKRLSARLRRCSAASHGVNVSLIFLSTTKPNAWRDQCRVSAWVCVRIVRAMALDLPSGVRSGTPGSRQSGQTWRRNRAQGPRWPRRRSRTCRIVSGARQQSSVPHFHPWLATDKLISGMSGLHNPDAHPGNVIRLTCIWLESSVQAKDKQAGSS